MQGKNVYFQCFAFLHDVKEMFEFNMIYLLPTEVKSLMKVIETTGWV